MKKKIISEKTHSTEYLQKANTIKIFCTSNEQVTKGEAFKIRLVLFHIRQNILVLFLQIIHKIEIVQISEGKPLFSEEEWAISEGAIKIQFTVYTCTTKHSPHAQR